MLNLSISAETLHSYITEIKPISQTFIPWRNIKILSYGQNCVIICALARSQIASQILSVHLHVTARINTCGFSFNFMLGKFVTRWQYIPILDISGKNTELFAWRHQCDFACISECSALSIYRTERVVQNKVMDKPLTHLMLHTLLPKFEVFLEII